MIDHIFLPVSDLNRSSEFYKKLLEPLGIEMPYKFDQPPIRGFAINNNPGFWLKNGEVAKDLYVAFTAKSADAVSVSYKAAIDAGATSIKEPSLAVRRDVAKLSRLQCLSQLVSFSRGALKVEERFE